MKKIGELDGYVIVAMTHFEYKQATTDKYEEATDNQPVYPSNITAKKLLTELAINRYYARKNGDRGANPALTSAISCASRSVDKDIPFDEFMAKLSDARYVETLRNFGHKRAKLLQEYFENNPPNTPAPTAPSD